MEPLSTPPEIISQSPSPYLSDESLSISSAVSSPAPVGGGGSTKWATEDDFNRYRTIITELYESKTLSQVIETMKNRHGFMAT
ncbi:hypothetical protein QBC38DRAFT_498412 [Podospora fimiseda]|uniref:Clr5 domain-containing protein n=1 Tax=Podospora fimiseda TaxID=252190 RepID=A0AAN7H0M4_9PEZI|nr:hypothetical protein QBC38DRAFT_498412 [Podospora fimiseda]